MGKATDATEQIMGWIQANYYLEMQDLLESAGWTCESKEEAPWYTTDCPRSSAMQLHNEALTNVLGKLDQDSSLGPILRGSIKFLLKQKFFSDRDIQAQVKREAPKV